jgi:hypothetical protein
MTIAFVNASTAVLGTASTSVTCNKPTNTAEYDVMVAIFCVPQGQTITNPSGWTTLNSQNASTGVLVRSMYKVAGPSEGASYAFATGTSDNAKAVSIMTFRGCRVGGLIRSSNSVAGAAVTSRASTAISGLLAADMAVILGGARPESSSSTNAITGPSTGGWTSPAAAKSGAGAGTTFGSSTAGAYQLGGTGTGTFTTNVSSGIGVCAVGLIAQPDTVGLLGC